MKPKTIIIFNLLFQLLWFVVALLIGNIISFYIFDASISRYIFGVLLSFIVYFLMAFVYYYIKAFKDSDVRAATNLGMNVNRYRWYRKCYDEWQDVMNKYGAGSKEADEKFEEFFPKIKNLNEWRRYQEYRLQETLNKMKSIL